MSKLPENIVTISSAMEPVYDKGIVAWSQVLVSHLLVINGFGYLSAFGLFQSYWQETFGRPESDIAWVGSIQLFLLFFIGTWSGRAMDAGYFKPLLLAGCSLQLLGVFTTSAVTQYWQLILAQGVVQGIGNGLLFTPLVALVSVYFLKRRAFALSLAASGAPIGGVIFAIIARQLIPRIGFPWTVRVMGFVILFNTIFVLVLARPRVLIKSSGPLVEWRAFKERTYSLFAVGLFFVLWGVYIAYFYTTTYGVNVIHTSAATSLVFLVVLNAAGVAGRIVPALAADLFFGPYNVLLLFTLGVGLLLLGWMAVPDAAGFEAWVIVYGICANAVQTLFPSTLASLTTDMSKMGVRTGMVFTIGSVACLTGAPLAGALIEAGDGSYHYMQIFGGVSVLLGTVIMLAGRLTQNGRQKGIDASV